MPTGTAAARSSPSCQPGSVRRPRLRRLRRARAAAAPYPKVHTDGLAAAGYAGEAAVIQEETAKQDRYLEEISRGLDQLKAGAHVRMRMLCCAYGAPLVAWQWAPGQDVG
jgi:hypothetical protein